MPYIAPLLTDFAAQSTETIRYMEIGAYEGRNLAFLDWLLPNRLDVTAIDPWFNEETNADSAYHGIEARYHRNVERMAFPAIRTLKTYSSVELPLLRTAGERFDLIYVDGRPHRARRADRPQLLRRPALAGGYDDHRRLLARRQRHRRAGRSSRRWTSSPRCSAATSPSPPSIARW